MLPKIPKVEAKDYVDNDPKVSSEELKLIKDRRLLAVFLIIFTVVSIAAGGCGYFIASIAVIKESYHEGLTLVRLVAATYLPNDATYILSLEQSVEQNALGEIAKLVKTPIEILLVMFTAGAGVVLWKSKDK